MEDFEHLLSWLPSISGFFLALLALAIYNLIIIRYSRKVTKRLTHIDNPLANQVLDLLRDVKEPIRAALLFSALYFFMHHAPIAALQSFDTHDTILRSILVICFFWAVYNTTDNATDFLKYTLNKSHIYPEEFIFTLFQALLRFFVCFMGTYVVAREWNFDVSAFLASLSIGSLALAFAAKDALSNVFGSIVIIIEKPFVVGDWIIVKDIEGIVEQITFRSTIVRTFTDEVVAVPNSLLTNTPIYNMSRRDKQRIVFTIGLTYSTTAEQIQQVCSRIRTYLEESPITVKLPGKIRVHFTAFNSSSLDIKVDFFISTTDAFERLEYNNQLNLEMMKILDECGVSCAFPSRSIYFENSLNTNQQTTKEV